MGDAFKTIDTIPLFLKVPESAPLSAQQGDTIDSTNALDMPAPTRVAPAKIPKKQYQFAMNKLSLISISLGLMVLGAVCFGLGAITTLMFISSSIGAQSDKVEGPATTSEKSPQETPASPKAPKNSATLWDKAIGALGLGNPSALLAEQKAKQPIMNIVPPKDVPSFLQPLVSSIESKLTFPSNHATGGPIKNTSLASTPSALGTVNNSPEKTSNLSPQVTSPSYTIQLGSFSAKANAEQLVGKLQAIHYPATIVEQNNPSLGMLYVVQSGVYPSYEHAAEAAKAFFKDQGLSAMPVALPISASATPAEGVQDKTPKG